MIELTKKNSILDLNLMRLTRKFNNLEEQEKMLRKEYHAKDSDMAEKDVFVQKRINSLKEWKASAMNQLNFLYDKLRIAVPISELDKEKKSRQMDQQRLADLTVKNSQLTLKNSLLEREKRENIEAEEKLKVVLQDKEALLDEFEVVRRRLETFDEVYKWENRIFKKIADVLIRAEVSLSQAFEHFDRNGDGVISKAEFTQALNLMQVDDLTSNEINVLYRSIDTDDTNSIDYREFIRKLEHYGVKNMGSDEVILYQLAKTIKRLNLDMHSFFEMVDTHRRQYITRQDFKDLFDNL